MLLSSLFLKKTEQPSNTPPFEQSALYLSVFFSFDSKTVAKLASDDVDIPKINNIDVIINGIFIKKDVYQKFI